VGYSFLIYFPFLVILRKVYKLSINLTYDNYIYDLPYVFSLMVYLMNILINLHYLLSFFL